MVDVSQQLIEAMENIEAVADTVTPEAALTELDETALQVFWRDWPQISAWAGSLWRKINQDLAEPAGPDAEGGADVGGGG